MIYILLSEPFLYSAVPMVLDSIISSGVKIGYFNCGETDFKLVIIK